MPTRQRTTHNSNSGSSGQKATASGGSRPAAGFLQRVSEAALGRDVDYSDVAGPGRSAVDVGVFVVAFALYLRTLHPSVAGGDAGELMVVAHECGTPHPPGYPTFAMATKAAEVAIRAVSGAVLGSPVSVAWAQNAFHATLSACAAYFVHRATVALTGLAAAGVVAAAGFAFAPNVWTYAVVTEVFPLNNFFMSALVWLAVAFWRAQGRESEAQLRRRVRASAFVCGLALTNQHTSVLFVVPIAAWVVLTDLRRYVRDAPVLVALVLLGLSPYLYLPLSSALVGTTNSWGRLHSWAGFWHHFLRAEYGTFSLASKEATYRVSNFVRAWTYYVGDLCDQVGVAGAAAFAASAVPTAAALLRSGFRGGLGGGNSNNNSQSGRYNPPVLVVLWLVWALYCNFFNYLSNLPIDQPLFYGVQQRFWIQPLIIVAVLAGATFAWVTRAASLPPAGALALAVVLAAIQVAIHFADRDESANYYVEDFGRSLLEPLPNGSILLTKGDLQINSARFAQSILGVRPDVRILDQELLTYPWYNERVREVFPDVQLPGESYFPFKPEKYDMKRFLDANRATRLPNGKQRRVFVAFGWKEGDPTHLDAYALSTFGSTNEAITKAEKAAQTASPAARARRVLELQRAVPSLDRQRLPALGRYANYSWEHVVTNDFMQHLVSNAYELMTHGESLQQQMDPDTVAAIVAAGGNGCFVGKLAARSAAKSDDEWASRVLLCGLLRSKAAMEDVLRVFGPLAPNYVRRNLGVVLQTLLRVDGDAERRRTYNAEMLAAMEQYVAEAGSTLSAAERANMDLVIQHLRSQQQ